MKEYMHEREILYKERDSLNAQKRLAGKKDRESNEKKRRIESLAGKTSLSFNQSKTNMDTLNGSWYGLYTRPELEELYNRFQYQVVYGETGRRQVYITSIKNDDSGDLIIDKQTAKAAGSYFLDGGFLLDKQTAMPVHLQGRAPFLIVHKDQIGAEGRVQVSRVNEEGKISWSFDTKLKDWADWIITPKQLFVFGTDNKELSNGEVNRLWCIDLSTGRAEQYDYFND
jgi:hypothetical protein